jgi:hypothetical protein
MKEERELQAQIDLRIKKKRGMAVSLDKTVLIQQIMSTEKGIVPFGGLMTCTWPRLFAFMFHSSDSADWSCQNAKNKSCNLPAPSESEV